MFVLNRAQPASTICSYSYRYQYRCGPSRRGKPTRFDCHRDNIACMPKHTWSELSSHILVVAVGRNECSIVKQLEKPISSLGERLFCEYFHPPQERTPRYTWIGFLILFSGSILVK